jgi:hypothetical protein
MSEEVEEIVALLQKFPLGFSNTIHWAKKDEWFKEFKPQVEALLEDHVSRAQLKKLHNDFPKDILVILQNIAHASDSLKEKMIFRMPSEDCKRLVKWLERLEAVTGDTKLREVKQ